jgi:hypothetical protein
MRGLAAQLVVVGFIAVLDLVSCGSGVGRDDLGDGGFVDPGPTRPGGADDPRQHRFCANDGACSGGMQCTRTMACWPPSQIRAVHVTWTLKGMPADATTCSSMPELEIAFSSDTERVASYAPVPCVEGKFTIDKLPTPYTRVRLGIGRSTAMAMLDADGTAALDLSP